MTDKVQAEIKGDVATIVLNKPERLNAFDNEMWHGIGEACRAVNAAPDRWASGTAAWSGRRSRRPVGVAVTVRRICPSSR